MQYKILLVVVLGLFVSGCALTPSMQDPALLHKTHGYLYVNFPNGGMGWTLRLSSVADGEEFSLAKTREETELSYGAWLPEGDYRITEYWDQEVKGLPPVTVKAGRITDLGDMIPLEIGGYEFLLAPYQREYGHKNAQPALTELKPYLISEESILWISTAASEPLKYQFSSTGLGLVADLLVDYERHVNKPPLSARLRETSGIEPITQLAKQKAPPTTNELAKDAEGNVYFGGTLGQIKSRSKSGEWTIHDTGSMSAVTTVEVATGALITGHEDGTIRRSLIGTREWEVVGTLGRNESVFDIDCVDAKCLVIGWARTFSSGAGALVPNAVNVYQAKSSDLSLLSKLRSEAVKSPAVFPMPRGEVLNEFYFINLGENLWRLDMRVNEWKQVNPPSAVTGIRADTKSDTLTAYRAMGAFSKLFVSIDNGETWIERDPPPYVILSVHFQGERKGEAVRWNMGPFSGTLELLSYDAASDDWTEQENHAMPEGCVRILNADPSVPKLCVTNGGSIIGLNDGRWTVEYFAE